MFLGLFRRKEPRDAAVRVLFGRVAEASRRPELYLEGGIADTFEGRFEALVLHVALMLQRLKVLPVPAGDVAQDFIDATFAYLELGFRQGGISDIAVPKRMKKVAASFYGRAQAYEAGLAAVDDGPLLEALRRNATGSEAGAVALARYLRRAESRLGGFDLEALLGETEPFPPFSGVENNHAA